MWKIGIQGRGLSWKREFERPPRWIEIIKRRSAERERRKEV